ncbi:hypothetical protein [Rhodococcoides kyotonense]|uniref:Uncharacterized protein n=1 Tax=Rhodococcoides kyotonense TaxID=398843 RepID=A0A239MCC5_9NOCA|nr:hypothetical protein [Rhodococcus kyotonensis]SNT39688.1 hypothetical protein SAMN05421642_11711 [Rhodococcus kyotonensis]
MKAFTRAASVIVAAVIAVLVGFGVGSVGHASPPVDPVSALQAAGVPTEVAVLAAHPTVVAGGVDAVIDRSAPSVTDVPTAVQVGWVNLRTGDSGVSDGAEQLVTGAGPVVVVVYGGRSPTAVLVQV